jgi:hypothetical protein
MLRATVTTLLVFITSTTAPAADQKDIDAAIGRGTDYLKGRYKGDVTQAVHGIGPIALAGVALIEARVPANDPALKNIATAVRQASYTQTQTYQIAISLIFLDRLEDPADIPLIQMLAVRLLVGQNGNGGWTYNCTELVSQESQQWLKANLKPIDDPKQKGKMHPDVAAYAATVKPHGVGITMDDNSNTQFGILALWLARKHGVPVDAALDRIEKRFLSTQDQAGTWSYSNTAVGGSPAMACSGLLGLATGIVRKATAEPAPKEAPAKTPKPNDPFFTPAARPGSEAAKKDNRPRVAQTVPVQRALAYLAAVLHARARGQNFNANGVDPEGHSHDKDLYFWWSLERVGVVYGVDTLGGIDWYNMGADELLKTQGKDGAWGAGSSYGPEVCTSFALLFLLKADLARDLSSRNRNPKDNELRAGTSGGTPANAGTTTPMPKGPVGPAIPPTPMLPSPTLDEAGKLALQLVQAPAADWTKALETMRDAKGGDYTKGLVQAIHRLDGARKKEAREALAERLTRMSEETLRGMMKGDDAELRRGAVLAAAMKDEKAHVPDLIDRLLDDDEAVVRAAKAGLKSLTSQDFGPKTGATKEECKTAAAAWKAWWAKQKK